MMTGALNVIHTTQAPICRAKTYPLREDLNDGFGAVSSECRMTRTGRFATFATADFALGGRAPSSRTALMIKFCKDFDEGGEMRKFAQTLCVTWWILIPVTAFA